MLYGLYQYAIEQLDALVAASSCIGVCIRQCDWRWCGELHIVGAHGITSVVLALVSGGTGWEKRLLNNVIPVLACLKDRTQLKTIAVEGDVHVGRALAAVVSPKTPLVVGLITQRSVFNEVQQDGNVPSRRHILGSKIFKEQLLEKFGKKIFFKKKIFDFFFRKKVFFRSHNAEKLKKRPFRLIQSFLQTENFKKIQGGTL